MHTSQVQPPSAPSSRTLRRLGNPAKGLVGYAGIGLALVAVVLAWAMVHAVFMLRYARLHYATMRLRDQHGRVSAAAAATVTTRLRRSAGPAPSDAA